MTTIRELIDQLEDIATEYGDDLRIVGAHQPAWPLAEEIGTPVVLDHSLDDPDDTDDPIAWLPLAGRPDDLSPYAPSGAFTGEW